MLLRLLLPRLFCHCAILLLCAAILRSTPPSLQHPPVGSVFFQPHGRVGGSDIPSLYCPVRLLSVNEDAKAAVAPLVLLINVCNKVLGLTQSCLTEPFAYASFASFASTSG